MILLGLRKCCDGLVMSATGRRHEAVVLVPNTCISTILQIALERRKDGFS